MFEYFTSCVENQLLLLSLCLFFVVFSRQFGIWLSWEDSCFLTFTSPPLFSSPLSSFHEVSKVIILVRSSLVLDIWMFTNITVHETPTALIFDNGQTPKLVVDRDNFSLERIHLRFFPPFFFCIFSLSLVVSLVMNDPIHSTVPVFCIACRFFNNSRHNSRNIR